MPKLVKKLALIIGGLVVTAYVALLLTFQVARTAYIDKQNEGGKVIETRLGAVEYRIDGNGPYVLFAHGTPGNFAQSRLLTKPLADSGFSVLTISRPGYGRTPLVSGPSFAEHADLYAALLEALNIEKVAAIGASGGGPSIVEFAIRHPDRLWAQIHASSLFESRSDIHSPMSGGLEKILVTLFGDGFLQWVTLNITERVLTKHLQDPETAAAMGPDFPIIAKDPDKIDLFIDIVWTGSGFPPKLANDGWYNDLDLFTDISFSGLDKISTPTLIVNGDLDQNTPYDAAQRMSRRIPGAQLETLEGYGHFVAISDSNLYWSRIIAFLRRHSPDTITQGD